MGVGNYRYRSGISLGRSSIGWYASIELPQRKRNDWVQCMSDGTLSLDDFRARYSLRPPQKEALVRETKRLGEVRFLEGAPATDVSFGAPPRTAGKGFNTYLWVIDQRGVPYILEEELPELCGEKPKHTNLTEGRSAYMGGELWFQTHSSLWLSGKSGRYGPQTSVELDDSVAVFRWFGYTVRSLGWDDAAGWSKAILEEP